MATDRGMSIAAWLKAGRDPWAYPGPLSDSLVAALPPPADQPYRVKWDSEVAGFGLRITKAGARSFVVEDRDKGGKQWRLTLGSYPDWTTRQAREAAGKAKQANDSGLSPTAQRPADRAAPTLTDLCNDIIANHLPEKRPSTQRDYRAMIDTIIRPALGKTKVAALRHIDGENLVREIARRGAKYRANRVAALLSLMGNRAVKLE